MSPQKGTRMTVLVIAAHPDDEVLGCGATMARLLEEGHDVHVLILGEGQTSRSDDRSATPASVLRDLEADARAAAAVLGVTDLTCAGLPDNRFDALALLDVVKIVERQIARVRPQVIYTHHPGDLNVDHGVAFRAVVTATRPVEGAPVVDELYAFEVASSTEWAFARIEPTFRPNVFVDVSPWVERKVQAMECYRSERRQAPHPRSPELVRAAAVRWGAVAGVAAAEPFELIRAFRRRPR